MERHDHSRRQQKPSQINKPKCLIEKTKKQQAVYNLVVSVACLTHTYDSMVIDEITELYEHWTILSYQCAEQ